jgi:hypothetical protein
MFNVKPNESYAVNITGPFCAANFQKPKFMNSLDNFFGECEFMIVNEFT